MNHYIVDPEPGSPALQTDSLPSEPPGKPIYIVLYINYQSIKKGKKLFVGLFVLAMSQSLQNLSSPTKD